MRSPLVSAACALALAASSGVSALTGQPTQATHTQSSHTLELIVRNEAGRPVGFNITVASRVVLTQVAPFPKHLPSVVVTRKLSLRDGTVVVVATDNTRGLAKNLVLTLTADTRVELVFTRDGLTLSSQEFPPLSSGPPGNAQ